MLGGLLEGLVTVLAWLRSEEEDVDPRAPAIREFHAAYEDRARAVKRS